MAFEYKTKSIRLTTVPNGPHGIIEAKKDPVLTEFSSTTPFCFAPLFYSLFFWGGGEGGAVFGIRQNHRS